MTIFPCHIERCRFSNLLDMPLVLWFSLIFATGVYICGPIMDPDLWWHITIGRWILSHSAIPHQDYWNLFGQGHPWRAYSWSFEIVVALVERNFGMHGLLLAKLLLACALALVCACVFSVIARDWFLGTLLGVFATASCFNHFTLRPQSLVWIYYALVLLAAESIAVRSRELKNFLLLSFLMCLWANTHLSAALGVGSIFVWLVWRCGWKVAVKGALFGFGGSLITPYLGGEWITFISKTGHPFEMKSIAEFQAATVMQHSTAFLLIVLALLLTLLHLRPRALDIWRALLCAAFALAALAIVKFIPFAVILLCACVASVCGAETERTRFGNLYQALLRSRSGFERIPKEGLTFVALCTIAVNLVPLWKAPLSTVITPVAAVDFMIEKQLPHPFLNDFGRGGYLMYRLSDAGGNLEHKVSIDGRTNVNPAEIWSKAHDAFFGKVNWSEYFDQVHPKTVLWPSESPLSSILIAHPEWCRVFSSGEENKGFSVFVTRAELLRRSAELSSADCSSS